MKNLNNHSVPTIQIKEGLKDKLLRYVLGEDIFISYSRQDATNYAVGLANELAARKFWCHIDQWGAQPGKELPEPLLRALRRSTGMVLVSSKEAIRSGSVRLEIEEFLKTGRIIIPIDIDGTIKSAPWWPQIDGIPASVESSEAVKAGQLSKDIINRVDKTFSFNMKNQRLRKAAKVVSGLVILLVGVIGVAGYWASVNSAEAIAQSKLAGEARTETEKQLKAATESKAEADVQAENARIQREEAQTARGDADEQKELAREAGEQRLIAERRTKEAKRLEEIAKTNAASLGQVSLAARLIGGQPDEALIASASAYRTAPGLLEVRSSLLNSLLHYPNLKKILRGHQSQIDSLAYTQNGRILVSMRYGRDSIWGRDTDGQIVFWDTQSGRLINSFPDRAFFNPKKMSCVADGSMCASLTTADNPSGVITLWRTSVEDNNASVNPVADRIKPGVQIESKAFTLISDELLVAITTKGELLKWDLTNPNSTSQMVLKLKPGEQLWGAVEQMVASPDKQRLAIASKRGIYLVDLSVPSFVYRELPGTDDVTTKSLSFSRGSRWLAIGRSNNAVIIMDGKTGELSGQPIEDAGSEVAFNQTSPSGQLAMTNPDGNISVGFLDTHGKLKSSRRPHYPSGASSVVFFPGDKVFFATGGRDGSLALWQESRTIIPPLAERLDAEELKGNGNAQYLAFDKSGARLLAIDDKRVRDLWSVSEDQIVQLKPPKHLKDLNAGEFQFALNCLSPDRGEVLCFDQREVSFNDPTDATKEALRFPIDMGRTLRNSKSAVLGVGKKLLATLGFDDVTLWDVGTGKRRQIGPPLKPSASRGDMGFARCLALSRDNKLLAVGYDSGEILVWNTQTRQLLRVVSPFIASDKGITKSGQVISVALNADGSVLASSSRPSSISLWDTATGNLIGRIDTNRGLYLAHTLALSDDGKKLVAAGTGQIFMWNLDPSSLAKRALSIANSR